MSLRTFANEKPLFSPHIASIVAAVAVVGATVPIAGYMLSREDTASAHDAQDVANTLSLPDALDDMLLDNNTINTGNISSAVLSAASDTGMFSADIAYVDPVSRKPLDTDNFTWNSDIPEIKTLSMMISYADTSTGGGMPLMA